MTQLMNMVDDATGVTLSLLAEAETIAAAMTLLWKWIASFGVPAALHTDRKNLYVPDEEMALRARLEGEEKLIPSYIDLHASCNNCPIRR